MLNIFDLTEWLPYQCRQSSAAKCTWKMALVQPPQTRTEVVAVDAHIVAKLLLHLIENLRESPYIISKKKKMYMVCKSDDPY